MVINPEDLLFVLTVGGKGIYEEDKIELFIKIIIFREETLFNLTEMAYRLNNMKIEGLHIFSINIDNPNGMEYVVVEELSKINYVEVGIQTFIDDILNNSNRNFLEYNNNSLYILRNGNYVDIKLLLTKIQGQIACIGRGATQKSHIISPLELRLSSYLMALSNYDFKFLSKLNMFNDLDKYRYLKYIPKDTRKK